MKKNFQMMAICLLALATFATSCKKDDEKPNVCNVGSTSYDLGTAVCYVAEEGDLTTRFNFFFAAPTWSVDDESNWEGHGFDTNLYYLYSGANKNNLPACGKYVYSDKIADDMKHSGDSDYLVNEDSNWIEYGYDDDADKPTGLTITIHSVSKSTIEISWTGGVDEYGDAVSGYYNGKIKYFEE